MLMVRLINILPRLDFLQRFLGSQGKTKQSRAEQSIELPTDDGSCRPQFWSVKSELKSRYKSSLLMNTFVGG